MSINVRKVLGVMALLVSMVVQAQTPSKNVTIFVPQPAGNPTDGVARKIQPLLQKAIGQTVVVENLPGAGGSIGTQKMLTNTADGTSILIASQTEPILTPYTLKHVKYKPEDMLVVGLVSRLPYVLVGRPDFPANNVTEFLNQARQAGKVPLNFGHIGPGSMIHLLGEQMARKGNYAINGVPYKGVPPVVQDLIGGQIDYSFLPLGGSTLSLIEAGKVKAYATTGHSASVALPKLPRLVTSDKAMTDFVYGTWIAFLVSAKTPPAVVERLISALQESMKEQEFQYYVTSTGMELANLRTSSELNAFYAGETRLYQGLARAVGVEPL